MSVAREVALADNRISVLQVEEIIGFSSSSNNRAVTRFQLTRSYNKRAGSGRCQATKCMG